MVTPYDVRYRLRLRDYDAESEEMVRKEKAVNEKSGLASESLRAAQMVKSGQGQTEAIDRGSGIWECRGIGNSYLVTTPDGNILVNAGTLADAKRGVELFAKVSGNDLRYIVLTQSHANQYGGLEIYKTDKASVIAHRLYPTERVYNETLSQHYHRGSRRFFGNITGRTEDLIPTREVTPDHLIGDEGHSFVLGGRRFEVVWTPGGETRSAVIVWMPDERVAIVGNLFGPLFGNHPNLNTLRGDKPRSALQFIESVKKVRALGPEQILTGHEDIRGAERIRGEMTRIIDAVQWVHDYTVDGMNEGKGLCTLMNEIRTPPKLALTEEYGKASWNVRAIWHEYTGWFNPERGTTELYGVPPSSIAPALAELAGGTQRLAQRAYEFIEEGNPLQALHLLDVALGSDPECQAAIRAKNDALMLLDEQTGGKNLWERMWIASQIKELRS